jgi:uncharacterized damage-inducible protein DinB
LTYQELQTLLDYHYWARDRVLDAIAPLTHEQLTADRGNSFSSILDTVSHLVGADWVWCKRWESDSPAALPRVSELPTLDAVRAAWRDEEQRIRALVARLGEDGIQRPIEYSRFDGKREAFPFWQMFQHLVNHGSYHRGQITTMLRQLEMASPKPMDLIAFYREHAGVSALQLPS